MFVAPGNSALAIAEGVELHLLLPICVFEELSDRVAEKCTSVSFREDAFGVLQLSKGSSGTICMHRWYSLKLQTLDPIRIFVMEPQMFNKLSRQ